MSRYFDLLAAAERRLARMQGKGWGTSSIAREVSAACALLGRAPSVLVDIGGNKGLYAQEVLRTAPGCDIVIFEPAASNVAHMRDAFRGRQNVRIVQNAVSDTAGQAILYSDQDGSGLASLTKRDLARFGLSFEREEPVHTIVFEAFWKAEMDGRAIDLCKIDIEGYELAALHGFGEALGRTQLVQFEFGGTNIDTRTYLRDFWTFFDAHGFDLYRITPRGPVRLRKYRESEENFTTTNFLALRRGGAPTA